MLIYLFWMRKKERKKETTQLLSSLASSPIRVRSRHGNEDGKMGVFPILDDWAVN
jgi:hypothetical protein